MFKVLSTPVTAHLVATRIFPFRQGFLYFCPNLNLLHPKISMHIIHTVLYVISLCADKENLFCNPKVPSLMIISVIVITLVSDSVVIL